MRAIGVGHEDRNAPQDGWKEAHPLTPISQLRSDDTGLVLPLKWASDNQRVRVRLRFDMHSEGESSFEHIAILTPGA